MRGLFVVAALTLASCGKTSAAPPPVHWYDLKSGELVAQREHKPVLIFGCAQWSVADMQLDHKTFTAPAVRGEMQDFIAIRIDLTDDEDLDAQQAKERFKIVGVPTILAIRSLGDYPNGRPWNDSGLELFRINELVTPEELVPKLQAATRKFREEL